MGKKKKPDQYRHVCGPRPPWEHARLIYLGDESTLPGYFALRINEKVFMLRKLELEHLQKLVNDFVSKLKETENEDLLGGPLPIIHHRQQMVRKAELQLAGAVGKVLSEHRDLTEYELLQVVTSVMTEQMLVTLRYAIRMERHNDPNKPGGLEG